MIARRSKIKDYTVVTTVYNDEKEILTLLKELENQSYQPAEVIVVDGGSSDNTVECVKKFGQNSYLNIRVIFGERLNIAQGLNRGIQEAYYGFVGIAMCGNHYKDDFFQRLLIDIDREEDIVVSYGAICGVSESKWGKKYVEFTFGSEERNYLEKFPTNHGNLARKDLYEKLGFFYEKFQYAGEDREFFLRVKNAGYKTFGDPCAVIRWETPSNVKQYYKQQTGYTISDMEMYDNKTVLNIYGKRAAYVLMCLLLIPCLLLPKMQLPGLLCGTWLLYKNVRKMVQYGITGCVLLNLSNFVPILAIIKNGRFLKKKNKLSNLLKTYY